MIEITKETNENYWAKKGSTEFNIEIIRDDNGREDYNLYIKEGDSLESLFTATSKDEFETKMTMLNRLWETVQGEGTERYMGSQSVMENNKRLV